MLNDPQPTFVPISIQMGVILQQYTGTRGLFWKYRMRQDVHRTKDCAWSLVALKSQTAR